MPALNESELSQLRESLSAFSEDAMRHAIEQARDPDKAAQLIQRLRDELTAGKVTFAGVAMCVVLSEAGAETAIPVLLQAATHERETTLQHAAAYALQRMGPSAMTAVMAFIESATQPSQRVLAYEILRAAVDCGPDVAARTRDFCLARAAGETTQEWPSDGWNPAMAVCNTLLEMGDPRLRPILEDCVRSARSREEREDWKDLLEELQSGEQPVCDFDWRIDWLEQCKEWANAVEWDDEDGEDEAITENDAHALAEELADEFEKSAFARSLGDMTAGESASLVESFLEHAWDYEGMNPSRADLEAVRETLYDWTPRKVSAEPEYFEKLPLALGAYFRFLHATGRLPDPEPFLTLADEARKKLPRLAADPANWGMAKSLFMQGTAAGFDMTTEEGMRTFQAVYNASLLRRMPPEPDEAEDPPDPPDYVDVTEPVRRTEPRVGRNDPCPCGSGKKFKKCCGR